MDINQLVQEDQKEIIVEEDNPEIDVDKKPEDKLEVVDKPDVDNKVAKKIADKAGALGAAAVGGAAYGGIKAGQYAVDKFKNWKAKPKVKK